MMALTLYVILAFGTFLAACFEGEKPIWAFVAGVIWPVVWVRVVIIRAFNGSN